MSTVQTSCLILFHKQGNAHKHTHMHIKLSSESTLTPWKELLIDQSALTAAWCEPLTRWLQRACVQWPCKGSWRGSALPWGGDVHKTTHTHTHTHTRIGIYVQEGLTVKATPCQTASGIHGCRAVGVCVCACACVCPVRRWRYQQGLPPVTMNRSSLYPLIAPPSFWSKGEQVQHTLKRTMLHLSHPFSSQTCTENQ